MNFETLKKNFDESQARLENVIKEFPWKNAEAYTGWLANSYHYAFNSTRLLALAAGVMPQNMTKVSNRFISHAAEEKGHEKLLENDVKFFGKEIQNLPLTTEMRLYYSSLYYWVSPAGNPLGLLGWVLSLEGIAANYGGWIYETVKTTHGAKAATFLRVHSDADPEHVEKALLAVKSLGPDDMKTVATAMEMYTCQYENSLNSIAKAYEGHFEAA